MRLLYSRRNNLTSTDCATIKDEHGQIIYLITGKWGKAQDVLSIYSIHDELLAQVKQKSFGIFPRFDLYVKDQRVGSLRRYYGVGREMLFVKGLNWVIIGNIFNFNYKIYHRRDCLMSISEIHLTNGQGLEFAITNYADEPLCLCIAAILDHFAQKNLKEKHQTWSHQRSSAWT